MDVYNSVSSITDSGVPAYFKSLVKVADAEKAYEGFRISAFDSCYHDRVSAIAGLAAAGVAGRRASKSRATMQALGVGINGFGRIPVEWLADLDVWQCL